MSLSLCVRAIHVNTKIKNEIKYPQQEFCFVSCTVASVEYPVLIGVFNHCAYFYTHISWSYPTRISKTFGNDFLVLAGVVKIILEKNTVLF
jgi:hypothetical protein